MYLGRHLLPNFEQLLGLIDHIPSLARDAAGSMKERLNDQVNRISCLSCCYVASSVKLSKPELYCDVPVTYVNVNSCLCSVPTLCLRSIATTPTMASLQHQQTPALSTPQCLSRRRLFTPHLIEMTKPQFQPASLVNCVTTKKPASPR